MNRHQIFRSGILNADGSVNVGYLVLFRLLRMLWIILSLITAIAAAAVYSAWPDHAALVDVLKAYATSCGIVASSMFVSALAGVGAFLWGDSHTQSGPIIGATKE